MALLTLVARASDGLPLSASILDDEQSGRNIADFQTKAKQIFRKLTPQSPPRCSIESPPLVFQFASYSFSNKLGASCATYRDSYVIEEGICYLALCEPSYPPRLAFAFLDTLHTEFSQQHGHDVHRAQRPYHFIEFGAEINKIKKNFTESQSRRSSQLKGLDDELRGVHKVMFENIDAVLQRGELISELTDKAGALAQGSRSYRKEARYLNLRTSLATKIAIAVVLFLFLIFLRYWLF